MAAPVDPEAAPEADLPGSELGRRTELALYSGAIALGAVLITITAITQPYNQNEWVQIAPYGSNDLSTIVSGTRQPPLDPLLGAIVQHLLGEGQLRQRLIPVLCGIGTLAFASALLRRMRLGALGVVAAFILATAPVFVRYSAYIRPYALPMFLMVACCYLAGRWLETGRRRWLAGAALCAVLLPLARVPEPVSFLGLAILVLGLAGWRRTLPRARAYALAATFGGALVTVGMISFLTLASKTSGEVFDLSPAHAVDRFPAGVHELTHYVAALYAHWFPWWPITLLAVVLMVVLRDARHLLLTTWYWLPLVAGPVVFLLAYHFVNPYPLDLRHYRARFAYFLAVPLVIGIVAVARAVARSSLGRRWGTRVGLVLPVAMLVAQLPTTALVLTQNDVPDYGQAGDVLRAEVPQDAMVLYDSPAPIGVWRQPFSGQQRYLVGAPPVRGVPNLAKGARLRASGPVYLLLLDAACAGSVVCDSPEQHWGGRVPGYHVISRFDRFTLYAPDLGQQSRPGAIRALAQLRAAYGHRLASSDMFAQAQLMIDAGRADQAHRLVRNFCDRYLQTSVAHQCFTWAVHVGAYPAEQLPDD